MTTNYEKIKNMTIEEMTGFLYSNFIIRCRACPHEKECGIAYSCLRSTKEWLQLENLDENN